jgi:hypothetical protein
MKHCHGSGLMRLCESVPVNALVLTGLATWRSVPYERPDTSEIGRSDGTRTRVLLRDRQAF